MNPRLLVVEDHPALADNMVELFAELAMEPTVVASEAEALSHAADPGFDLALVDLRLGGRDAGLELVPRLRELAPAGEIILVTGNATLDSAIKAIRQGVFAYVLKPFDPDELLAMGQRALEQVALRREGDRLARDLADSESLYRGVVDAVPAFIIGLDSELRVVFVNDYAARTSGYGFAQVRGQRFVDLFTVPEEVHGMRRILSLALAGRVGRDLEHSLSTRAGEKRVVRWTIIHAHGAGGGAELLAVGLDVTERLELELKAAEARAMAMMGTLTAGLAHEIRNPLNAAKLQLELMTRGARRVPDEALREKILRRIDIVGSEMSRLSSMLEDFLSLARPRGIQLGEVDVRELLEWVTDLQRPLTEGRGVSLDFRCDDIGLVAGDGPKLKQVLINLVQNSLDAMGDRGAGRILMSAEVVGDEWVRVCVDDDGPGFGEATREQLVEPFMTTKEAGTGLGLTIVQNIVARHGGQLSLGASAWGGARVGFSLKRIPPPTP